jgi:hypothetical protein
MRSLLDNEPFSPDNEGYTYVAYVVGSFDMLIFFHALVQLIRILYYEIELDRKASHNTNVPNYK